MENTSLKELIKNCHALYRGGKYNACYESFQCAETESEADPYYVSLDLLQKLCLESNLLASNFMLSVVTNDGVCSASAKQQNTEANLALKDLLHKVKSIPSTVNSLCLEVTTLYNLLVVQILQTSKHLVCVEESVIELTKETLLKVCMHFGRETKAKNKSTTYLLNIAVDCCCQGENKVTGCLQSLLFLSYIWATYMLLTNKPSEALACLESLSKSKDKPECALESTFSENIFRLPVDAILTGDYGNADDPHHSDLVHFLCGMAHYHCDIDRSFEHLRQVKLQKWLPYTKYMLAHISHRKGNYVEALSHLSDLPRDNFVMSNKLRALHCYIFGSCLAKLNKPFCAIQKFQEAVHSDPTFMLPLFCIARQYHNMAMMEAELETLNLLVTTIQDQRNVHHQSVTNGSCLLHVIEEPDITLQQLLYILSQEYSKQKKFENASQSYLDLLASLTESEMVKVAGCDLTPLPKLDNVYMEAAHALLQSKQYDECIVVCDRILSSGTTHSSSTSYSILEDDEDIPSTFLSSCGSGTTRKRSRSPEKGGHSVLTSPQVAMIVSLYKADALMHSGEIQEAVDTLDRLADDFNENPYIVVSSQHKPGATTPKAKRQRVSSEGHAAYTDNNLDSHADTSNLMAEVYGHLGVVLTKEQKYQDALHYFRISLQLNPESMTSLYNCTVTLRLLDKCVDASTWWCQSRKMDILSDSFQMAKLLQQKKNKARSLNINMEEESSHSEVFMDAVPEQDMLRMDVQSLETLSRSKSKSGKYF